MPTRTHSKTGGELFIVDNSDDEWKALRYLHDWCDYARSIDVASAYFEIGALLALDGQWQKTDGLRVLMGDEVAARTRAAFDKALGARQTRLNASLEAEKEENDFLDGVPAIVQAIASGKIQFRVYRKAKFHAKAYITHARSEVIGAAALVGSSNFTRPGLTQNIELNVQITGQPVSVLQEWFEEHWDEAEDVTPDMLRVVERHVQAFSPFEVWAQSLKEYFSRLGQSAGEWETTRSKVWPVLDGYQREGYGQLLQIAGQYGGAFLCDGVGLGKTFIGLMLVERLLRDGKRVVLIVPKSGRKAVWEKELRRHLPDQKWGGWHALRLLNHTDLSRPSMQDDIAAITAERNAAIIIDEAHNFRNPGLKGQGEKRESRYRILQRMAVGKPMFLLTATPVNNGVFDLMHLIELFSPTGESLRGAGVHSLRGHFRTLEKAIRQANAVADDARPEADVDQSVEIGPARDAFRADVLVQKLVVQRSRAYVKASQQSEAKGAAIFPTRRPPVVAQYELSDLQQRLLDQVVEAFDKQRPLLTLALYDPSDWRKRGEEGDAFERGRREQVVQLIRIGLIKRLESSTPAFELSCCRLFARLLGFWRAQAADETNKAGLEVWERRHAGVMEAVAARLASPQAQASEGGDEDDAEDFPDLSGDHERLDPGEYEIAKVIAETQADLETLARFIETLRDFTPAQDGKLAAFMALAAEDPVLSKHKVLVFSEYRETARHLEAALRAAGTEGVARVDGGSSVKREEIVTAFAPYYNRSSSAELAKTETPEIRVLIATDVLSEGLNLQDATRLINYDLHWNPVRLMQRVGRVDRRLNGEIEARLIADHPEVEALRGEVAYWNFFPTQAVATYLDLYGRLDRKVTGISRLLGVETGKLLTPDDEYDELRLLNERMDGELSEEEALRQELRELLLADPTLEARLDNLPERVRSVRAAAEPQHRGVFFCYALPGPATADDGTVRWDLDQARQVRWYFRDAETGTVLESPFALKAIAERARSTPDTPRTLETDRAALTAARQAVEAHIDAGHMRRLQAPMEARPVLKAWMEVN